MGAPPAREPARPQRGGAGSLATPPTPSPAVFLDRDGTLVRDHVHAADPAALALLPGVPDALRALSSAGYRLVVITNNSGVARGLFTVGEARAMGRRVAALLEPHGVKLGGYFLCPHHPTGGTIPDLSGPCGCRKPAPGMLLKAADRLGLDLPRSWMVGDLPSDVGVAVNAGARPVLIDVGGLGYPSVPDIPAQVRQAILARNLPHAAALILTADGHTEATLTPCPMATLVRPSPPPDDRSPGAPSPFPDAARLSEAEEDAAWLRANLQGRRERSSQ